MDNYNNIEKETAEKLQKLVDDIKKPFHEAIKVDIKKKLKYINKPIQK